MPSGLPSMKPAPSHEPAAPSRTAITIELSNGSRIEFPQAMPAGDIEQAVGQLEAQIHVGGPMASHDPERPSSDGSDVSLVDRAIPMALRVLPAIGGGVVGAIAGPPGIAAGGFSGSAAGEIAAQAYERETGQRRDFNPVQMLVQGGLGAIPAGKAGATTIPQFVARRGIQGGGMGAVATTATELAETGELPSAKQLATGTALGTVLGAAGGRFEGGRMSRAAQEVSDASRLALPPGARYVVTLDGQIVPIGTDIPMSATPDGSYVRSVPAEYARREIAGALPPGREPIITPPPDGSVPTPQPDASYVRSVRGEYARREPRALLPGGTARYVAGETGPAVPIERADEIAIGAQPSSAPSESYVRSQRAAVLERDIDTTKPTGEAIRPRQYSGDPNAVDAPLVGDAERGMLERMRQDLLELPSQRGRLVRDAGDPNASIYAHGGPGSPVGDDVRTIAGNRPDNATIVRAIDDLLEGKPPTNKTQVAALDAARGYLDGREGYRGPALPFAGDVPLRGGGDADEFAKFEAVFDEVAATPGGREPGELGFVTPQVAMHVAGGLGGAATGAAAGDTPQERIENAILYGLAGAAAPALVHIRGSRVANRAIAQQLEREGIQQGTPAWGRRWQELAAQQPDTPQTASTITQPHLGRVGRQGQPTPNPTSGFEPFVAKFSNPLVRQGVTNVLHANGGFATQRRGVIDHKTLGRFANEVRVNVSKVLPKGTALSAEQITGYAKALQQTTQKVNDLSARVNTTAATDADVLALQAAIAEQRIVAQSIAGARAEAGRALAAFNFWNGILDTNDVDLIRQAAGPLKDDAAKIAKGIATLPDDPLVRFRWMQQQQDVKPWEHLRTYYLSNLLSGPRTHFRNILGNLFNAVADTATLPVAAGIDVVKSAVKGTPRTVRLTELPATVQGSIAGFEKGFHDMLFAFRHGIHPASLRQRVDLAATKGKLDLPPAELPGGGWNPLNWPFRALQGPDALNRAVAYEGELSAILFNHAKNEGLSGERLVNRVADLRGGMSSEAVAIRQQAQDYALRRTFIEEPGDITKRAGLLLEAIPGSWLVVPFLRITSAIARQGAQFSPLGFAMKAARQGGRAGTQAQARATAGTMAAGYLFWLAATGRLSGNGPQDRAKRAALLEGGWRPNSVRIGDQWVTYQTMQPLSTPAAVIANGVEAWQERGSQPDEAGAVVAETFSRSVNSFLESSFLEGVYNIVEAVKEPGRMPRALGRMASNFVPGASLLRTIQQARDPVVRQPETFAEHAVSGIPGLAEQIPPRIDRFGEAVVRDGGSAKRALDPFNASSVKPDDTVSGELDRLMAAGFQEAELSPPSDRLKLPPGVTLTREEETQLKQAKGRAVRQRLEQLMSSPGYAKWSDEVKAKRVRRVINAANAAENNVLRRRKRQDAVKVTSPESRATTSDVRSHPVYGRVRIAGEMSNGTVRVVKVLPDGSLGGRHHIVRREDLRDE